MEGIEAISRIVKRNVTIWDNLHANDYDQTRLYLGPYSGRDSQLTAKLRGVLTNPNLGFEMNYIAIHTLAQWSQNKCTRFMPLNASEWLSHTLTGFILFTILHIVSWSC